MVRVILVVVLGAALFVAGGWYLGMFNYSPGDNDLPGPANDKVAKESDLGDFLYKPADFVKYKKPASSTIDPIVLQGILNPRDQEEVCWAVPNIQSSGRVLFIGEGIDPSVCAFAGSAPLIAEPFYPAKIRIGDTTFLMFYRRIYEGQIVHKNQMVAMIDPTKAVGNVLDKAAKIEAAEAEVNAADKTEREAEQRWIAQQKLMNKNPPATSQEDYRGARLTHQKTIFEYRAKVAALKVAKVEESVARTEESLYEIRPLLPHDRMLIKSIQKQQGSAVKPGDTIVTVQNLERLQAEAPIELAYYSRLERRERFSATIEPTTLISPIRELPGHARDINSVAVSKDMKIVSGSDDRTVCVWEQGTIAPVRKWDHDDAVQVVACTPPGAAQNLCLAGCSDGSIWIWNLDDDKDVPVKKIEHANGSDAFITSLAFSPDGTWFASGGNDGSIKLWTTATGTELYPFDRQHGVEHAHDDAVTSLHFTPQCRLVSASRDKTLRVWRLKDKGAVLEGKPVRDRGGNVANLGVTNDGTWMLFDQGRTMKLYSVEHRTFVHTFSTPANSTPFDTLAQFSPDGSLILTAGASEGRLQLWRAPDAQNRAFEVRQYATKSRAPVTCAAFSPETGKEGQQPFIVSASGSHLYLWSVPTPAEVREHRIEHVPLTLTSRNVDPSTGLIRIGFEVPNPVVPGYPYGRFEAGRTATIVID